MWTSAIVGLLAGVVGWYLGRWVRERRRRTVQIALFPGFEKQVREQLKDDPDTDVVRTELPTLSICCCLDPVIKCDAAGIRCVVCGGEMV